MNNQKTKARDNWRPLPPSHKHALYTAHYVFRAACVIFLLSLVCAGVLAVLSLRPSVNFHPGRLGTIPFITMIGCSVIGLSAFLVRKRLREPFAFENDHVLVYWLEDSLDWTQQVGCSGPKTNFAPVTYYLDGCPGRIAIVIPLGKCIENSLGSFGLCQIYVKVGSKWVEARNDWEMTLENAVWAPGYLNSSTNQSTRVKVRHNGGNGGKEAWSTCNITDALEFFYRWHVLEGRGRRTVFETVSAMLKAIEWFAQDEAKLAAANTALHEIGLGLRDKSNFGRHRTAKILADGACQVLQITMPADDPRLAAQEALAAPRRKETEESTVVHA